MTTRSRNWWRPRFGLRTLLILFTLVALLGGMVGARIHRAQEQRAAVAKLEAAGASVRYDLKYRFRRAPNVVGWAPRTLSERWDAWVASALGLDAVYDVHYVCLFSPPTEEILRAARSLPVLEEMKVKLGDPHGSTPISDAAWQTLLECDQITKIGLRRHPFEPRSLAGLAEMSQLLELVIQGGDLTVDDTAEIARLPKLRRLELSLVGLSDEALRPLARLSTLRSFDLTHRGLSDTVTDQGVAFIAGLTELRWLTLARLPLVTDRVFASIERLANLESLNLDQASIRGEGIERLAGLPILQGVNLIGTPADDESLRRIASLTQLEGLNLYGPAVTDAGGEHLRGLTRLTSLNLGGTQVSDDAKERLGAWLPGCTID